jgi:hypothetical protein
MTLLARAWLARCLADWHARPSTPRLARHCAWHCLACLLSPGLAACWVAGVLRAGEVAAPPAARGAVFLRRLRHLTPRGKL